MFSNQPEELESNFSNPSQRRELWSVWWTSLKLGMTSFGGPIAHLGYFHEVYVTRKKWIDDKSFADLVALCQFLPGPASSQVGIGIGAIRAGIWGAIIAWVGFTLPSVLVLIAFAYMIHTLDTSVFGWLHGLKLVAVAVVAHAVAGMGSKLAAGQLKASIAFGAMASVLLWQTPWIQVAVIGAAGIVGLILFKQEEPVSGLLKSFRIGHKTGILCLALFVILLVALPIARLISGNEWIAIVDSFYRTGSLVFGGGHVVLPLLETEMMLNGWMSKEDFIAGYGATQAVPGPLFTFAAYLGALIHGIPGAVVAVLAVFLPGFLLVIGAMPFWNRFRRNVRLQGVMLGMNAAVVGILFAALYDPIWKSSITSPFEFIIAAGLFVMLMFWKSPPWVVVVVGAAVGQLLL
ncbi:chromate transporter [Paenibacillus uliginis N3/975]|uniref:Chromate transporter n=1 Tax=Paenibacillus uliginis N3/975 TaxID=1313296 RepID=A0A1X7HBG8_9BACL|nr:chromate efflux transporter [Paenibacillus uliginis]SMF82363.1 chromate transporter [Paenibacillus uliginis N3/975]